MAEAKTVPPLPAGNVDFNELHKLAAKDGNIEKLLGIEPLDEQPSAVEIEAEQADEDGEGKSKKSEAPASKSK